ncbi:MAG: hypothetical protein ACOCQP_03390 [Lentisphaeria bacterium]
MINMAVIILLLSSGCASSLWPSASNREDKKSRKYTIQLYHPEKPTGSGSSLYKKLHTFHQDESITVRSIPLLTSKHIKDIEMESSNVKNKQKLKLILNKFGRTRWRNIRASRSGEYLAIAVDNVYKFIWQIPHSNNTTDNYIMIEGEWGAFIAEKVAEKAQKNHEEFN